VFKLKTGITWRELPRGVAGCSGVICWRRLRDWTDAGVVAAVHELVLDQRRALDRLVLETVVVDSSWSTSCSHQRALKGAGGHAGAQVENAACGRHSTKQTSANPSDSEASWWVQVSSTA
jgi:transposase